jgi:phosphatidylinositol alpha 1,6-mannosyltransferase
VLAPTRAVADVLQGRGIAGDVGVWGRGVDTELFSPARRSEELRSKLLDGGDVLLLSVGRVSKEKRLHILLEAFAQLRSGVPGARLAIVGDGPAREALEADAPEGVRFLGEAHGLELAELYATADAFCFTSTTDTFGQVLLEAAASGLPVAAVAAGGTGELVRNEETGIIVLPDDSAAFARALERLALDRALRGRLGAEGRALALRRTWSGANAELVAAYRRAARVPAAEPASLAAA